MQKLNLEKVIKRKNPYLFKAKNIVSAEGYVRNILDAFLSSQEEGIFGGFLENLAIFIANKVYHGAKSAAEGIDLEFEKDEIKYIVAIKSGQNWGNSRQIAKMIDDFKKAKRILNTNTTHRNVVAVNGCCYGKDNRTDKGDYLKLCGQDFWYFLSDCEELYLDIIEPFGYQAKIRNEDFNEQYANVVNKFTYDFIKLFCDATGRILWEELVKYNSARII